MIEENDITFVATETGTGKSTSIPKALFEHHEGNCKIAVTQPRRAATVRIATTVAELCDKSLGVEVGYWMRGERKGCDDTQLWYMTSYTLLLHLLNKNMNVELSHIILDEFHERQPDIEMLAALLKDCLAKGQKFKLVLMSATLTMDDWEQFFSNTGTPIKIGKYMQGEGEHPVYEYHLEEASVLTNCHINPPKKFDPHESVHPNDVENAMYVAQACVEYVAQRSELHHSILMFLPGRADAERFKKWIDIKLGHRLYPVIWHSHVDVSLIQKQLKTPQPHKQKIYLATDIAEVSITLPDVVFVVDLCLVKRPSIYHDNLTSLLYPPLVLQWISRASLRQRKGRVGRTQPGFYFSMLARNFVTRLCDYPVPPIQQSRLDDLTLSLFHISNNPTALYYKCCAAPTREAIDVSVNILLEMGCLYEILPGSPVFDGALMYASPTQRLPGQVRQYQSTFIGQVLQRLPVSVHQAMLVFYGLVCGLDSLMMLASSVSNSLHAFVPVTAEDPELVARGIPPTFEAVSEALKKAEKSMNYYASGTMSDVVACMYAYLEWKSEQAKHDGEWEEEAEAAWCAQRSLSAERLRAIGELYHNIRDESQSFHPSELTPAELTAQLNAHTDIIALLVCSAFSDQAIQVSDDTWTTPAPKKNPLTKDLEGDAEEEDAPPPAATTQPCGQSIFVQSRTTLPDMHVPSCVQWTSSSVIVPVNVSLRYGKVVVAQSTAVPPSMYSLMLLLFSFSARFSPNPTTPYMAVFRNGRQHTVHVGSPTIPMILDFRHHICRLMGIVLHRRERTVMNNEEFANLLLTTVGVDWGQLQAMLIEMLRTMMNSDVQLTVVDQIDPAILTQEHTLRCIYVLPPDENVVDAKLMATPMPPQFSAPPQAPTSAPPQFVPIPTGQPASPSQPTTTTTTAISAEQQPPPPDSAIVGVVPTQQQAPIGTPAGTAAAAPNPSVLQPLGISAASILGAPSPYDAPFPLAPHISPPSPTASPPPQPPSPQHVGPQHHPPPQAASPPGSPMGAATAVMMQPHTPLGNAKQHQINNAEGGAVQQLYQHLVRSPPAQHQHVPVVMAPHATPQYLQHQHQHFHMHHHAHPPGYPQGYAPPGMHQMQQPAGRGRGGRGGRGGRSAN
eukprot:TRINITY_DN66840_c7_g1_i1.p1 TRINITY_DN66840_c7_g1~~TRINITY_DN66840_c7_g1_i1.p1  ORF type:complete len:1209 (+),score=154.58 TRINITY_DN66840_c7_g1_i1:255-3629(+)